MEGRGKDSGALMFHRLLNAESNLCYGEVGGHQHGLSSLSVDTVFVEQIEL
jgi:hypothetical protein